MDFEKLKKILMKSHKIEIEMEGNNHINFLFKNKMSRECLQLIDELLPEKEYEIYRVPDEEGINVIVEDDSEKR